MRVTTRVRLSLDEHPFAEGETLVSYANRQAAALGIPGSSLRDVTAGVDRTDVRRAGQVCQQLIDGQWIEMAWEEVR